MNKKLFLGIVVAFLAVLSMSAQQHRYGFRVGLNYSDIDFDENISGITMGSEDARIGFTAGFFAQYYLNDRISIQPEIQYSAQGERTRIANDRLAVNVIQVPVLANFHIGKLTLSAGPQVGLAVWEWERDTDYETFQFSGVAGLTYDITDNFLATLRGSFGVTDIIRSSEDSLFTGGGANHYLQFTVAYRL